MVVPPSPYGPHMKPDLLVAGPMFPATLERLDREFTTHKYWLAQDKAAFLAGIKDKVRVVATTAFAGVPREMMDALPKLELVAYFTVGYDQIDMAEVKRRKIVLTNTPGAMADAVVELTFGLMVAAARRVIPGDRFVREGKWLTSGFPLAQQVIGKRIGILGMGRIGRDIAKMAEAWKMPVAYHSRRRADDLPYTYCASTLELAKQCDFLVAIVPGGPETRHIINEAVMKALGPQGVLVNVARGSVVDEQALLRCLSDGSLGAAALDVFDEEPRVPEGFFKLENVVLQPHVGSATHDTRRAMGDLMIDNIAAFFAGKPLLTPVAETLASGKA